MRAAVSLAQQGVAGPALAIGGFDRKGLFFASVCSSPSLDLLMFFNICVFRSGGRGVAGFSEILLPTR